MNGFKLLAIRPLEGCNPDYLKVLKTNQFYTFYNNYSFSENPDTKRIKVEYLPEVKGLYDIQSKGRNISVNVSAIVGQNGSGKSSLLELYYLSMYFIAINREKPFLEPNLVTINNEIADLDDNDPNTPAIKKDLLKKKAEINKIIESFMVQLFYSVDDTIYLYDSSRPKIDDLEYDFVELLEGGIKDKRDFVLSSLFETDSLYDPVGFAYSCVINYSIFGLNAIEMGEWITTLFHKNDAYRTPIVINPMRTNGDFIIEDENELLSGRLLQSLAICLKQNETDKIGTLLGTQRIPQKVVFRLKRRPGIGGLTLNMDGSRELLFSDKSIYEYGETNFLKFKEDLGAILDLDLDQLTMNNLLLRYCLEYAYSKSGKIYNKYPIFRGLKTGEDFLKLLIEDKSHITLKFRQAINFITGDLFFRLKASIFNDKKLEIDMIEITESDYEIKIEYSLDEIKKDFEKISDELSFVPPPIFEINFVFSDNPNDRVNLLSSGESQSAHSLNAVYYHLRNIDSMNRDQLEFDYKYINIILDEVELYHHPEMQRTYLHRLLKGIEALNLNKIEGINILFSTHSPFILSDIPSSNILRLEKGDAQPSDVKTFGANIYDLLADDFFMKNGFIGEHAMSTIKEILDYVNASKYDPEVHIHYLHIVSLIGEESIRMKLEQMLDDLSETEEGPSKSLAELKLKMSLIEEEIRKIEEKK